MAFTLSLWGLHFNCVLPERSKCSQRTTNPISPSFNIPDGFGTRSRTWSPTWKLCQAVLTKCRKLKVNGSERSQTERAIGKFRPQVFCQSELFRLSSLRVSGQSQSIIFHWCCRGGNIIKNTTHSLNTRQWINLAKMWSSCTVVPASFRQPLLYPFSCDTCRCQHWRCMWILSSFKATFSKSRQDTIVLARHHTNHPLVLAVCYSLVFHRLISLTVSASTTNFRSNVSLCDASQSAKHSRNTIRKALMGCSHGLISTWLQDSFQRT